VNAKHNLNMNQRRLTFSVPMNYM